MPQTLFDSVIFAPLLLSADGTIVRAGTGWSAIFDVEQRELVGRRLVDLALDGQHPIVDGALDRLGRGAPSVIIRFHSTVGGRSRRLRFRMEPSLDGILAVAEDVTDRRSNISRNATVSSLVDTAHDAWFVHDMEGRIVDTNPWACESTGYSREELLSLHIAEIEQTIRPGRMDGVWNRMEVGQPMTVEGRHRRKDGTEFPVEVRLSLFETEDDQVMMLAIIRDITIRKAAEQRTLELNQQLQQANAELKGMTDRLADQVAERTEELRTTVNQLETTFAHLADGLCSVSCQGEVLMVNPAFTALLGIGDPTGQNADETLPEAVCDLIRQCLQHHERRSFEFPLTGGRIFKGVASPIGDRDVDTLMCEGAVLTVRDITLEKEIDRMKTDFIATVSHELRTPLTSILGFAKLTSQRLESKVYPHVPLDDARSQRIVEQVRGNVEIILTEGQRLTALINDVLDISKMEAGRMEWHMSPVSPVELAERARDATSALFAESPVAQVLEIEPHLPLVLGDHDRLLQVLINLISNAAKFTEAGAVTIGARRMGDGVEFSVRDTGDGIEPAMHESIFEKFRQVGDTLTSKPQGTGLGLPICKQIVAAHGGEIRVASTLGGGSIFSVVIPTGDVAGEPLPRVRDLESLVRHIESRVPASLSDAGSDVLVVDDDPSLRELLRQQLTDRGYEVRLAENGAQGMTEVRLKRPDLVILDVMMPEISGFDVAAMLKADPATSTIPILILSIVQDKQRGYRLGVDRYMTKPADADELLSTVQTLLEQVTSPRRVLVVDESTHAAPDMVRLLEAKGYQVVGTCKGHDCLAQAKRTRPDLILVESMFEGSEDLVRTIRFERGLENVYVVQLMDPGGGDGPAPA